ncbi:hypothetical protein [Nocardioides sp. WS12]|uniref:hypothetical protein n=1 Tax=Nocardioides sp. WS12 TaxID=2486272 RepID=UPI0015F842D3|nr:hypothetical protein [Nocardioides sp. WS12]
MSYNQPPPPGGPGAPPPPPGGGYGAPPPGGGMPAAQWDLGAAVNYAWTKFQANMTQFILAALALFAGIAITAIVGFVFIGLVTDFGTPFVVSLILNAIVFGAIMIVAQVIGSGLIRGALGVTEGRPFAAADALKFDNIGPVLITSLMVGGATIVGTILCYLPGIIIGFFTSYSLYFVIDKRLAPVEAIKASIDLVKNNIGNALIWYLVGGLIGGAGAILCGVGLIFTLPIALIGTAYTYKVLTGQQVAA